MNIVIVRTNGIQLYKRKIQKGVTPGVASLVNARHSEMADAKADRLFHRQNEVYR